MSNCKECAVKQCLNRRETVYLTLPAGVDVTTIQNYEGTEVNGSIRPITVRLDIPIRDIDACRSTLIQALDSLSKL